MWVSVRDRFVEVFVFMMLGHVQPDPYRHESSRYNETEREAFSESKNRDYSSKERRCREVGARPRCTQVPKRDNIERQAQAISQKAGNAREKQSRR